MVQACGGRSGAQPTAWPLVAAMTQPPPAGAPAKKHVRLQERRGSSVALVLDVRSLGAVEPICSVNTPREVTLHFLRTAGRPLTPWALQHQPPSPQQLEEEFLKIPPNFVNPEDLDIPGRASKDRYKTILPNPQSRVCLGRAQSREAGGYINANYIRGYDGQEKVYIATQGPMPNTVLDFWEMVWQEGASVIVMLTQLRESKEKCVHYWPTEEDTYGPFRIRVQEERELPEYSVRRFTIQHQEQCRLVRHVLFSAWPDHQTPESAGPLLRLVAEVEDSLETAASTGPIVVHCSAGIGRTGCFIATRIGCQQLKARGEVDILGIVCQLRLDRGGMIQTAEQYQFLHRTLALYAAQLPGSPAPEPWRPPPAWAGGPSDLQTPGWPRGRGAPSVSVGSQDTDQPRPPPDTRSSPLAVPLLPLVAPSGPQGEPACASVCGTGAGLSADLGEPPGAL